MKEIKEDEVQFVARHYEENALNTERAWQRFRKLTGRNTQSISTPEHPLSTTSRPLNTTPRRLDTTPRRLSTATRRIAASASIALIVGASVACGVWYVRHWNTQPTASDATTAAVNTPYRYLQPAEESVVLKYDNAPIEDVLGELSSYYGRNVVLQDAAESSRHISGEIEATSLEEVIEILEATLAIDIEIQNN